jgi:hypothetical protein
MFTRVCKDLTEEMTMGPEDQHEQPAEQDGYEKWLDEQEKRKLADLLKPKSPTLNPFAEKDGVIRHRYSQASELDADEWDAEHAKGVRE